jgi:hypothetical protein
MKKALMFFMLLASCSTPGTRSETFVMSLDNVQPPPANTNVLEVPARIKTGDELRVRISVAFGGCEAFKNFESKRTTNTLELTPIGNRQLDVACTAIYGTQWVEFADAPTSPRSNPFTVIVHRANGADLGRSVSITP